MIPTYYAGGERPLTPDDISQSEAKIIEQIIIKSPTIPTASADTVGEVRQYVGETGANYTHGYIYECQQQATDVITFTPDTMAVSGADFMTFLAVAGVGTDYETVVKGTMTYDLAGDIWRFEGKDVEDNTVVTYQQYTLDYEDAGFTMPTDPQDGDVVSFEKTTTYSYSWERIDVQPGGSRGRFLAIWNCTTGLAESNPPSSPYPYATGDYFIVGAVGAINYKPSGSSYVIGTASTVVETAEVKVDDTYYFDGTNWRLQRNTASALYELVSNKVTSLSNASTDTQYPSAKCVYDSLTYKQDSSTAVTHTASTAAGNSTTPVYIASDGTATALSYSIEKSVPSNAVFTDTTYSAFSGANGSTAGTSGLVPAPTVTDNVKFLKGDGTWAATPTPTVDQSYNSASSNAQSGVAIAGAGFQTTSNLVTSLSNASTDTQYPSAKCVYDIVGNIETLLQGV